MEENMIKTYHTKTSAYNLGPSEDPILGIEVPAGFIEDLDLKVNEILKWTIDTEAKTATITKENIILNK